MRTFELVNNPLPTHLNFRSNEVFVKGKGDMQTYLVTELDELAENYDTEEVSEAEESAIVDSDADNSFVMR